MYSSRYNVTACYSLSVLQTLNYRTPLRSTILIIFCDLVEIHPAMIVTSVLPRH